MRACLLMLCRGVKASRLPVKQLFSFAFLLPSCLSAPPAGPTPRRSSTVTAVVTLLPPEGRRSTASSNQQLMSAAQSCWGISYRGAPCWPHLNLTWVDREAAFCPKYHNTSRWTSTSINKHYTRRRRAGGGKKQKVCLMIRRSFDCWSRNPSQTVGLKLNSQC